MSSCFLSDKQPYVQRVAAEAHVVLEQNVCHKPDIKYQYETLQVFL